MIFVKLDDLKKGMRMGRPIFTRDGALLFERDMKLTENSINTIRNFGLLGLYVLEPAEPAPPLTEEEIEFERFQTVTVYSIQKELDSIIKQKKDSKLHMISDQINKQFGYQAKKIHFSQSLRSSIDYAYKHALNTSILSALIGHTLNAKIEDRNHAVTCSLLYNIGSLLLPRDTKLELMDEPERIITQRSASEQGLEILDDVFLSSPMYHRICSQVHKLKYQPLKHTLDNYNPLLPSMIIWVASTFDDMTSTSPWSEAVTELTALKYMLDNPERYDPKVVNALIKSITVLEPGVSVVLSNGKDAMVIKENSSNFLQPMVLTYSDNKILDLSQKSVAETISIKDIMTKMDHRYKMTDIDLSQFNK